MPSRASSIFSICALMVFSMALMLARSSLGMMDRRFFSIVCISISCRRRTSKSLIFLSFSGAIEVCSGLMLSPKWAISWASILSVFASCPMAPANRRTWRGLATTTGKFCLAAANTKVCSRRPVASITIRVGWCALIRLMASRTPFASLLTVKYSPTGRI